MKKLLGILLLSAAVFCTSCEFVSKEELRKPDIKIIDKTISFRKYNIPNS